MGETKVQETEHSDEVAKEDEGEGRAGDACILESSLNMPSASRRVGGLAGFCKTLTKGF